ncbi:hypothetical protein [Bacillus sp. CECT 9360]|uniref:hypothetical protein n=1 Tax=Bacillus sp. CECT 9360 TaxID=2845821 RepID=UPI001E5107A5|nr:hypothetical protein [Bacillus sp. CECT 9360]CAH0344392.1 hypothetical protein BCI9360_00645 [Bacillus sp. CECT 9360]
MKNKKMKISALVIGVGLLASQSVMAAWSSYGTFSVTDKPKTTTTTGVKIGAKKESNDSEFSVYASAKTMYTDPDVRLVNSNIEARSSYVEVYDTDVTITGNNNVGDIGYTYYAQVKPDAAQAGTDTIRLKINPK